MIPLCYEDGTHIKANYTDERHLKESLARHLLDRHQKPEQETECTELSITHIFYE